MIARNPTDLNRSRIDIESRRPERAIPNNRKNPAPLGQ